MFDPRGLQVLIDLGHREGCIDPEIDTRNFTLVAFRDGIERTLPAVGAVHIAGTQDAAFQIAELVEHEQRVIAGALIMTVSDTHPRVAGRSRTTFAQRLRSGRS